MAIDETNFPQSPVISGDAHNFSAIGIHPSGDIYVADAIDYQQNGHIYRYNSQVQAIDTFDCGIIPIDIVF
jgi:hypothetical protein